MEEVVRIACPSCNAELRPAARYCDHCGAARHAATPPATAGAQGKDGKKQKPVQWMVEIAAYDVVPYLLEPPTACWSCGEADQFTSVGECIEKVKLWQKASIDYRGDAWLVRTYERFKCKNCGKDSLTVLEPAGNIKHEIRQGRKGYWNDHLPLVRRYRGSCEICKKRELELSCPKCGRQVCSNEYYNRHAACRDCSPKCHACGAVSHRKCGACKKNSCKTHGSGIFAWRCTSCKPKTT